MAFLFGVGARRFGKQLAEEMVFSTANELLFDEKAKGPPSLAGVITDTTAKLIHDQFRSEMKAHKFEMTPMKPLSVPVMAPKKERVPMHDFTRHEMAELHKPFPMLESQAIQKLMGYQVGYQVIDTFDAGDLQRSMIQAASSGSLKSNRD